MTNLYTLSSVSRPLDRERQRLHEIRVEAFDLGVLVLMSGFTKGNIDLPAQQSRALVARHQFDKARLQTGVGSGETLEQRGHEEQTGGPYQALMPAFKTGLANPVLTG